MVAPLSRRPARRAPVVLALGLLLAASAVLAACGGHGHENSATSPDARVIAVTAESLAFQPSEITVRKGEPIAIELTSVDVAHDLTVEAFGGHVFAAAGQTAEGGFTADQTGTFEFRCTVSGHSDAGMVGTLTVTD